MSVQDAPKAEPSIVPPPKVSGIRTVLKYTGIPPSWLDKRPKLPSRNWLIFLSVTSSIAGLYIYDRRESKRIRQEYVDKVREMAEAPVNPMDWPRRVTVYGAKWPGDDDYDQSLKYFRKYVKPILVAAAVDYEMVAGKKHGDIANRVAEDIRIRRRFDVGLDVDTPATKSLPTYKTPPQRRQHELEGGIVIVGRPTFKEFMHGLKEGWSVGLEKVDREELLARQLADDGHFDEPEEPTEEGYESPKPQASGSQLQPSLAFSPILKPSFTSTSRKPSNIPDSMNAPPQVIPQLPPLLLVSFTNYIGLKQIPLMIWDFFNQRYKVQSGSEAGYHLVMSSTRPIHVPTTTTDSSDTPTLDEKTDLGDLDFDKSAEGYYKRSLESIPNDIEKARQKYYEALPEKLATARALSRGTREPTKAENENPPPTEVELRAERLKKERRWNADLAGWEIVKPSASVTWDDRFRDALRIFTTPDTENNGESNLN